MGDAHTGRRKRDKPLKRNWGYGPDFFTSLEAVQGVDREKVAHVMLEVVLGLDKELNSRGLHQLRTGEGGATTPNAARPPATPTDVCTCRPIRPAHDDCTTCAGPTGRWCSRAWGCMMISEVENRFIGEQDTALES